MANGNTAPSRLGDINSAAGSSTAEANFALFLKKFSGEVLTQFKLANVFMALHKVRTISSGKSAQFPVLGTAGSSYHTPGEDIVDAGNSYLSEILHAERVISIDHVLQSSTFIASIDELINHYDVRSMYATELAFALSKTFDQNAARMVVKAARDSATITGTNGGAAITNASTAPATAAATKATAYVDAIYEAAQTLEGKAVAPSECVAVVPIAAYYDIARHESTLVNRDFVVNNGDYSRAEVVRVADVRLVKSTNLPTADESTPPAEAAFQRNDYNADFSTSTGVVFHPSAIGTVKRQDLTTESEYQMSRQGHLMLAKMLTGTGVLRPESAVELKSA